MVRAVEPLGQLVTIPTPVVHSAQAPCGDGPKAIDDRARHVTLSAGGGRRDEMRADASGEVIVEKPRPDLSPRG
jgi:hypothetical protein